MAAPLRDPLGRAHHAALGRLRLSRDFKQSSLWDLRDYGFQVLLGIEDDRRNVEMLRSEGVPTLYRHSGYYD